MLTVAHGLWLGLALAAVAAATVSGEVAKTRPFALKKAPKQHVEDVTAGEHTYRVRVGGSLDEFSTASYPDTYGGCKRLECKFQPNRYLVLENVGEEDVLNPRVVVNGRRDWFSADTLLASVLRPGMTDAEKAMAIWAFTASIDVQCHENNRRADAGGSGIDEGHPSRGSFKERANPVKAANCYYCSGCSLSAANFVILCRRAGLAARAVWMSPLDKYETHCVAEAWHNGAWHLYDPEWRAFYLARDNTTIASYESIHNDPELVSRTQDGGFAARKIKSHAPYYAKHYPPRVMPVGNWLSTMAMTLRPGESFVWRWDHIGKYRCGDNPRNIRPNRPDGLLPYRLANGKLIYKPRLAGPAFWRGALGAHNLAPGDGGAIHPHVAATPGYAVYKLASPYPIVGGLVGGRFSRKTRADACRILLSAHDSDWVEVWAHKGTGEVESYVAIDKALNPKPTPAIYAFYVKVELTARAQPADAACSALTFEADVQMAATALPSLSAGDNTVVYRDESGPGRRARLTHGWRESTATRPPLPPAKPIAPRDGARVPLADLKTLQWRPAKDPDGEPIANHHIQVSPRSDFLHPVSPNFDRMTYSGKPRWPIPTGWLLPGRTYHWRVRARDRWGAWSPWSSTWTFTTAK